MFCWDFQNIRKLAKKLRCSIPPEPWKNITPYLVLTCCADRYFILTEGPRRPPQEPKTTEHGEVGAPKRHRERPRRPQERPRALHTTPRAPPEVSKKLPDLVGQQISDSSCGILLLEGVQTYVKHTKANMSRIYA